MDLPLPLPERIPKPTGETLVDMNHCSITMNNNSDQEYVTYTLPSDWKAVDNSWRTDLPEFKPRNDEAAIITEESCEFKSQKDEVIPSETAVIIEEPYEFKPRNDEVTKESDSATFIEAAHKGNLTFFKENILSLNINNLYPKGTILFYSIESENIDLIRFLLKRGVNPNIINYEQKYGTNLYPIEEAIYTERLDIIQLLIRHGATVDLKYKICMVNHCCIKLSINILTINIVTS